MKKEKKIGQVAAISIFAALALTACDIDIDANIEAGGQGTFTIRQSVEKDAVAEYEGISEDEVFDFISRSFQEMMTRQMVEHDEYNYSVHNEGDEVAVTINSEFTYDEAGWDFGKASTPTGMTVALNPGPNTATFIFETMDEVSLGFANQEYSEAVEWSVDVEFPGEIIDNHGGDKNGNHISWSDSEIQNAMRHGDVLSATGSLDPMPEGGISPWLILFGGLGIGAGGFYGIHRFLNSGKPKVR